MSSAKIIGKKPVAPAKMRIAGGNISPKSTVKSVQELSAVIYDLRI
jgi:hypothetical protein